MATPKRTRCANKCGPDREFTRPRLAITPLEELVALRSAGKTVKKDAAYHRRRRALAVQRARHDRQRLARLEAAVRSLQQKLEEFRAKGGDAVAEGLREILDTLGESDSDRYSDSGSVKDPGTDK